MHRAEAVKVEKSNLSVVVVVFCLVSLEISVLVDFVFARPGSSSIDCEAFFRCDVVAFEINIVALRKTVTRSHIQFLLDTRRFLSD